MISASESLSCISYLTCSHSKGAVNACVAVSERARADLTMLYVPVPVPFLSRSPVYGNTQASSALMAASSAAAAGDQGAVESYWSQATEAVGDGWSSYTSAYDSSRSYDEGTWSGEWSSVPEPTTSSSSASQAIVTPAPTITPASNGVGSGANGSPAASETGAAEQRSVS